MDEADLGSGSCSTYTKKKIKLDNSVNGEEDNLTSLAEKEKAVNNAMARWFIRAGITPNTINCQSFAEFIHYINPIFPLSLSKVEKEVLEVHEECKEKAKNFLNHFEGKLTLSYEWLLLGNELPWDDTKGPVLHNDFICLTAHFVDDNWKIRKWILGFTSDQPVPLEDLCVYPFRNAVQEFEIENKVSTFLLPDNEDFDEETLVALRKLIEKREDNDNQINPRVLFIYCCADLFRLMVDDMYSNLSWSLLEDLRMLVGWGRLSSTNWNVSLSHLQRAVAMKYEDAFSKDKIYDDFDKPSDENWITIQAFCKLAGCIYKVAKVLFEGEYLTSSVYFHLLAELKFMLNQELKNKDNEYFLNKAKEILERFDKYWNDMFLVLENAYVLDPRFKMKYLEFYCSKNKVDNEGSNSETVLDYLCNLYAGYAASDIRPKPVCPVALIDFEEEEYDDDEREEEEEKEPDAYKDFFLFQEYLKFEGSLREFGESDFDSYFKEPVMEWNKDFKALDWWREESQNYLILSRVARDILVGENNATMVQWNRISPNLCELARKILLRWQQELES